jgi:alkylhydroperoxidase family enzyme
MGEKNSKFNEKIKRKKPMRLSEMRIPPTDKSQSREVVNKMLNKSNWDGLIQKTIEFLTTNKAGVRRLDIYRIFMKNPDFLKALFIYQIYLLENSSVPIREREILILRIAWLSGSDYMWYQHMLAGLGMAGLSVEEIERTKEDPDNEGWSKSETILLKAIDELFIDAFISDDTWKDFSQFFNDIQLMEMLALASFYFGVAMMLKTLGVQPEGGWKLHPE